VKIFAPGTNIYSAWKNSNNAYATLSGTSMASPHVAGAAAIILSENPGYSPEQVVSCLKRQATSGALDDIGNGSPNTMLYVGGKC
jgi:subtilisin family serine protease